MNENAWREEQFQKLTRKPKEKTVTVGIWEERVGEAAYLEYAKEMLAERGIILPEWEKLPPDIQRVWGRVARAVAHKMAEEGMGRSTR